MYQSNRLVPQTLRSINSTTFTGSYQAIGTPLEFPARIIKVVNNSSVVVTLSWDGATDHDFLPIGSFTLYDCGTNKGTSADVLEIPQGTQISVKGAAGTGSVYMVVLSAVTPTMTIPL